jgi:hypothetical protein
MKGARSSPASQQPYCTRFSGTAAVPYSTAIDEALGANAKIGRAVLLCAVFDDHTPPSPPPPPGAGSQVWTCPPRTISFTCSLLSFLSVRASWHVGPAWTKTGNQSPHFALRPGPFRFPCIFELPLTPHRQHLRSADGNVIAVVVREGGYGHPPPCRPARPPSDSPGSLLTDE